MYCNAEDPELFIATTDLFPDLVKFILTYLEIEKIQ
jgi:hypothetical protein